MNEAVARLEKYDGIDPEVWSEIYETEPQGLKDQPWFANQIVRFAVDPEIWSPQGFMSTLLAVEGQMHRVRTQDDGPRIIDLDLILYGNEIVDAGPFLIVPHPRMLERAFVLHPLVEIAPKLELPDGTKVSDILKKIKYRFVDGYKLYQE